ncbi:MAG: hypothetical protein HFJ40_08545 [Clostridia bacterium]|nr:hypothetical protein [Clostridia bacterium]
MNNDEITNLLTIVLIIMIVILFILAIIFVILKVKTSNSNKKKEQKIETSEMPKKNDTINYNKQSIFSFMEFDKIEDNMIVRKNGNKFLMVIECQGVNYDLMSGLEKNSVEQGFLQFLNTLRYPIQIYVQTRTVNLESALINYKDRVREIKDRLAKKQMEYARKEGLGYNKEEIDKSKLEVTRERNLYEYGIDIINSTERMSLNKNILRKHYYVIIDYVPEDINTNNYAKEEISNMAFSELYTKAQSVISALGVCGVNGKILDSNELAELLYIAYNRDESEIYDLEKAINAEYDELYLTAPDVLDKRIKELNRRIEEEARVRANEAIIEVMDDRENAKKVREKEAEMDELINQMAQFIIEENEQLVGADIAEEAKEKVRKTKTRRKKEVKNEEE